MKLLVLLTIHVLSAAVLFGTGAGIAFFMVRAHRTRDPATVAAVARMVVLADLIFTLPAVVIQPVTGFAMISVERWDAFQVWLLVAYALYGVAVVCWLPVVWIQIRLRDLAAEAARQGQPLPDAWRRLYRLWFALGWPALLAMIALYAIMIAKPPWGLG